MTIIIDNDANFMLRLPYLRICSYPQLQKFAFIFQYKDHSICFFSHSLCKDTKRYLCLEMYLNFLPKFFCVFNIAHFELEFSNYGHEEEYDV